MRQLETQLEQQTGLALADYDVLAQLAIANGELRMTELANRALISRSGMTRRVARLVDEGLVRRSDANADGRVSASTIRSWPFSRTPWTRSRSTARLAESADAAASRVGCDDRSRILGG
jgi:DNA-binding Lrp family transcriptional regulator